MLHCTYNNYTLYTHPVHCTLYPRTLYPVPTHPVPCTHAPCTLYPTHPVPCTHAPCTRVYSIIWYTYLCVTPHSPLINGKNQVRMKLCKQVKVKEEGLKYLVQASKF